MSLDLSVTDIDVQELANLFKRRMDPGHHKMYAEVYWHNLDDTNNANYKGKIKWNTTEMTGKLPVWSDSQMLLPIRAKSSTGVPYDATTRLAMKNSILDYIYSLMVRPTGSGPELVNENNGVTPLMNAIRRLTASDLDWVNCTGQKYHFVGVDRALDGSPMDNNYGVVGAVQSQFSSAVPDNDVFFNSRLLDRVVIFSAQSDHLSDPANFDMIVSIPLKYVHPFFEKLSYPLPNYPMHIEIGVSSLTQGCEDYMPICTPKRSAVAKADAAGVVAAAVAIAAAPTPKLSIVPEISILGFSLGACRLRVKCVVLNKEEADKLDAELEKGEFKKEIPYIVCDMYKDHVNKPTSAAGTPLHVVFGQDTYRPLRVWALFPPTGKLTDATSVFPSTVGPCYIRDCNLRTNGDKVTRDNFQSQEELYQQLAEYQLGSAYRSIQGAQISYNDFMAGARYYLFNVERNPDVRNNRPITFHFDARLCDPASGAVDCIFIVEHERTAWITVAKNQTTTSVKQGSSKNE